MATKRKQPKSSAKSSSAKSSSAKSSVVKKTGLLLLVVAVGIGVYTQWGDYLSLASLAKQESQLRTFQADHPVFGLR
ncbi:hypothetical protein, partial [Novipirellula maiorica]|uniref:hypothetical protein n=1 Tax=Novipirellula maiorica TaxID=1265734 RepID=UPI000594867E